MGGADSNRGSSAPLASHHFNSLAEGKADLKMKKIILTQGKYALVDDEDFDNLMQWKWQFSHGYAKRSKHLYNIKATKEKKRTTKKTTIYLHRIIMGSGENIDHINGDKLDCRKSNLRYCNQTGNSRNKKGTTRKTSEYKGVCWAKREKTWKAQIGLPGARNKFLGHWKEEKMAALAYNVAAYKLFGEFAKLNVLS